MKTITRTFLISLVPLWIPSAIAEPAANPDKVTPLGADKISGAAWRSSEIVGSTVKNSGNETIGEVEDIIVDLKSSEILGVVVSAGGFLGLGDTLTSIPSSALRYDHEAKAFKTHLTKEQLTAAPGYKKDAWQKGGGTITTKLREFRDSMGGDVNAPDNSARNREDQENHKLTAEDQGNSETDLNLTKNIRMAVVKADLSFNAKNIKIITRDAKVTLRGVVDSADEHKSVLEIAKSTAGSAPVTDELEVKSK